MNDLPLPAAPATERKLRVALAERAYRERTVRLAERDLGGCTHLVSTRHGLFAVAPDERRLIAHGLFFGLTIDGDDIYAFESCDEPRSPSARGRIVRLRRDGSRIVDTAILAEGLGNGCHQIDLIGDRLFVTDTYRQRIVEIGMDGAVREHDPFPWDGEGGWGGGYVHINSIVASGDHILLLLHNGANETGRPSEVAVLDGQWRVAKRHPLASFGCHNFAILEDGSLLSCGSFAGALIGSNGLAVTVSDQMTRGLSVGAEGIVVGASTFSERDRRDEQIGAILFLDRAYRLQGTLPLPGPPMDIRRIDGADLSLSNHLSRKGIELRWPLSPPPGA